MEDSPLPPFFLFSLHLLFFSSSSSLLFSPSLRSRLSPLSFLGITSVARYVQSRDVPLTRKMLFHHLLGFYSLIIQVQGRECELWQNRANTLPFVLFSEPWCSGSHFYSWMESHPSLLKWWRINISCALLTHTCALRPFTAGEWSSHPVLFSSHGLIAGPCCYIF